MIVMPNIFLNTIIRADKNIAVYEKRIKFERNSEAREESIIEYIDFLCEN